MKSWTYLFCLIFMCFAHAASAIPLAASDDAGFRGENFVIVLTDPTPDKLDLWTLVPTKGAVEASSFSSPNTKVSSDLMRVWLSIRDNAPFGDTLATFQCHDVGNNLGCIDYLFDPVTAKITVPRTSRIPLPATL